MLRRHNLDDARFAQIAEQARIKIAEYFPYWSDLNTHDPGITLIELFAWLTEQQRFHMDQSQEAAPFFSLLGIERCCASAAETEVEIAGGFAPRLIPADSPLYAEDVRFETLGDIQYKGEQLTVRVIQRETIKTPKVLGDAYGLPDERFTADTRGQIIMRDGFLLTVGGKAWTPVEDFRASGPCDTHYILDGETGGIMFGDGIRGAIPRGEVSVAAMTLTRGPGGNIAVKRITDLCGLAVSQPKAAEGGAARESVSDALARAGRERRQAVTAEDIEQIVRETHGLSVEHARAFAAEHDINAGEPRIIHIAVKLRNAIVTDEIKEKIRGHLEQYRLVCRDFNIVEPRTIRVSLSIELRTGLGGTRLREKMETSLRTFFADRFSGFGKTLQISEIRAFAAEMPEVIDVSFCAFRVYGGAKVSADGDVSLAPDSLAILGDVALRILDMGY